MECAELIQRYQRGDRTFERIDLREQALIGLDLSHSQVLAGRFAIANLSSANLSHCSLNRADFNVARLSGANLTQTQLVEAQLNVANLVRAILTGANLSGCSMVRAEAMRCELSQAQLRQANLSESDLGEAHLRNSDLTQANLSRANLRHSCLTWACLDEAILAAADLTRADLQGTSLQQAQLKHACLEQANLRGANLRGACLRWANLRGADLSEADLTGAKLSGADLTGASLAGANLTETSFVHADLRQANLRQARWHQADLTAARLTGAKLHGSSCFQLTTHNLRCEWVDLSADGNGWDLCYFDQPDEIDTFFNRVQPTVEVLIDAPLSLLTHAVLAQTYADLGAAPHMPLKMPPSIQVDERQTRLRFSLRQDRELFALVCGVTFPFLCHRLLLRYIAQLTGQLKTADLRSYSGPQRQRLSILCYDLLDLCQRLPDYAQLSRQYGQRRPHDGWTDFVAQPLQLELTNSRGQRLTLYRSPGWGVHGRVPGTGNVPTPPLPYLDRVVTFLLGCHVEAVALHRRTGLLADVE